MPIYQVMCDQCGDEQEIYRSLAAMNDLPECCDGHMRRKVCAPMVIADIQPYRAVAVDVATGKPPVINSRSEHRAFLKRNGYVEVGNEMPDMSKRKTEGEFNVRQELREAVREVLPKYTR
jgi:hypothetical protein